MAVSENVALALALAVAIGAGCALFGDGGCNDESFAGSRAGVRYVSICGHILEFDDGTDQARYLGTQGDPALASRLSDDDREDLESEESLEPRPLAWTDLRIAASAPGVFVVPRSGSAPPAAVPVGTEGRSLGSILDGGFEVDAGMQFCAGAESGPVHVEIWQVRYRNPGGLSRLRVPLTGLARCRSRAAPAETTD